MNEAAAQVVLLVRAVEGADPAGKALTKDDRGYAARAAAELVRWQAADQGGRATEEAFIVKRAELLAARLAERSPNIHRALGAMRWRPWIGIALPVLAFAIGIAAEHIADRRHVNILAFPLLGLVVWNIAVYVALIVRGATNLASRSRREPGWIESRLAGARGALADRAAGPLSGALAGFAFAWAQHSAPLVAARAARILHVSAAMLAIGAVAGLYVRGMAFEYRAGWESTFLDANSVHAILTFFLQPAAWLTGQPLPSAGGIAALRWGGNGTGENAARWIHLYTATVMLSVVIPRLVL
ncbi:MAG TPA: DUF2868 domain-containing protein, partial [Usitatibacteraceae bacterium]|nr:DUF2868 domain-containing protein [Usitatibacteraceae bacterium]